MKKIILNLTLAFVLIFNTNISCAAVQSDAAAYEAEQVSASDKLKIGDYIQLGKYNDQPIIWRYAADDEHGKLIVSDKILCYKTFDDGVSEIHNLWEESFPRKWLNSTASEGEVIWGDFRFHLWTKDNIDADEKGFLHESNFTASERSVLKTVTQQTMVPSDRLDLATNGIDKAYNPIETYVPGSPKDGGYMSFYSIEDMPEVYVGAAYEITDTMFLMDEMQVYQMWKNLGHAEALDAENCARPHSFSDNKGRYFLRTPSHVESLGSTYAEESIAGINPYGNYDSWNYFLPNGIRPAFYLNDDNAVIMSGSGTEDDPYVIDGKETADVGANEDISVYCNGNKIEFDVPPIIENDIILVPFRAIFEALGAEVSWEESSQTAQGQLGDITIRLTIGSSDAYINGSPVTLDTAPKLVSDRTMVPLRFIAENFGYEVLWDENLNTVTINSQD